LNPAGHVGFGASTTLVVDPRLQVTDVARTKPLLHVARTEVMILAALPLTQWIVTPLDHPLGHVGAAPIAFRATDPLTQVIAVDLANPFGHLGDAPTATLTTPFRLQCWSFNRIVPSGHFCDRTVNLRIVAPRRQRIFSTGISDARTFTWGLEKVNPVAEKYTQPSTSRTDVLGPVAS